MIRHLYQVTLPYACYGLVVADGIVIEAAPIARWMLGKKLVMMTRWVESKKGWVQYVELL
jgi:hypothetical protein